MTVKQFIDEANKARRASNGSWWTMTATVNGELVRIKAYKTWVQIFERDGIRDSSAMDISVKAFKGYLRSQWVEAVANPKGWDEVQV